jgi:hypothetical protein
MVVCYHDDLSRIISLAKSLKLDYYEVILGEEGVRIDSREGGKSSHD